MIFADIVAGAVATVEALRSRAAPAGIVVGDQADLIVGAEVAVVGLDTLTAGVANHAQGTIGVAGAGLVGGASIVGTTTGADKYKSGQQSQDTRR